MSQSNVGFKNNPNIQVQHINVTFLVRKAHGLGIGDSSQIVDRQMMGACRVLHGSLNSDI